MTHLLMNFMANTECMRGTEVWLTTRGLLQTFRGLMFDATEKGLILSAHLAHRASGLLVKEPAEVLVTE